MLLELDQCEVFYSKRRVLNGISFNVEEGEILAIVGHNGAGKSTILKVLMGLVSMQNGSCRLKGSEIGNKSTQIIAEKGIRLLPADVKGIFPTLKVRENLRIGASEALYKDKKKLSEKVDFCLSVFPDLLKRQNDFAGRLSGGQQQMLALSIALMGNPSLLLLDEPSIGLAPFLVQSMLGEVRKLAKQNNSLGVILVEQNVKAAFEVADRVLVLKSGSLIHEASTSELSLDAMWALF
jgi:branched-chain amino acid transport system ATP-binding protein